MKISIILEKIDEDQLFVPAFQREYVWKRDDAKQLIDSVIHPYPTSVEGIRRLGDAYSRTRFTPLLAKLEIRAKIRADCGISSNLWFAIV